MRKWISVTMCGIAASVLLFGGATAKAASMNTSNFETRQYAVNDADSQDATTATIDDVEETSEEAGDVDTEGSDADSEKEEVERIALGSSQADAVTISLGTKVYTTLEPEQNGWLSFTTKNEQAAAYTMTVVNETLGSDKLRFYLYDEYGTEIEYSQCAEDEGIPMTIGSERLSPDTTYFIRLESNGKKKVDCSLLVKNPRAVETTTQEQDIDDAPEVKENDEVTGGTNADVATKIPLEVKVQGTTIKDQYMWFSFKTGEENGAIYNVTIVNTTKGSDKLYIDVYNEYGEQVEYGTHAEEDGTPQTISCDELDPNTTYYVALRYSGTGNVKYTMAIKSPKQKK